MMPTQKESAIDHAVQVLCQPGAAATQVLASLWDEAYEQGRLAALDELSGRFCVCMK